MLSSKMTNSVQNLNALLEDAELRDYYSELDEFKKRMSDNIESTHDLCLSAERNAEISDADIANLTRGELGKPAGGDSAIVSIMGLGSVGDVLSLLSGDPSAIINKALDAIGNLDVHTVDKVAQVLADKLETISSNTGKSKGKFKIPKEFIQKAAREVATGKYDELVSKIQKSTKIVLEKAKTMLSGLGTGERKTAFDMVKSIMRKLNLFLTYIKFKAKFVKDVSRGGNKPYTDKDYSRVSKPYDINLQSVYESCDSYSPGELVVDLRNL